MADSGHSRAALAPLVRPSQGLIASGGALWHPAPMIHSYHRCCRSLDWAPNEVGASKLKTSHLAKSLFKVKLVKKNKEHTRLASQKGLSPVSQAITSLKKGCTSPKMDQSIWEEAVFLVPCPTSEARKTWKWNLNKCTPKLLHSTFIQSFGELRHYLTWNTLLLQSKELHKKKSVNISPVKRRLSSEKW